MMWRGVRADEAEQDFMEYNRKGPNQGFWMIKSTIKIPDKEEMFKLVTPEGVCLSESMQVGQRHLLDAGYGKDADADDGDRLGGEDDSKLDVEQQLAPWSTTKNFMHANQNKAMLQLHGEGDPSGRGEAFSFIRVSMKELFLREGETMEERNGASASPLVFQPRADARLRSQPRSLRDQSRRTATTSTSSKRSTAKRSNASGPPSSAPSPTRSLPNSRSKTRSAPEASPADFPSLPKRHSPLEPRRRTIGPAVALAPLRQRQVGSHRRTRKMR